MTDQIRELVDGFVVQMERLATARAADRMASLAATMGGGLTIDVPPSDPGKPFRAVRAAAAAHKKHRRKPPIQLCPVPRCKERAAPRFSMLCAKHKDTPKAKVRKYREDRRARKAR